MYRNAERDTHQGNARLHLGINLAVQLFGREISTSVAPLLPHRNRTTPIADGEIAIHIRTIRKLGCRSCAIKADSLFARDNITDRN